jgi:hypothetical protein
VLARVEPGKERKRASHPLPLFRHQVVSRIGQVERVDERFHVRGIPVVVQQVYVSGEETLLLGETLRSGAGGEARGSRRGICPGVQPGEDGQQGEVGSRERFT